MSEEDLDQAEREAIAHLGQLAAALGEDPRIPGVGGRLLLRLMTRHMPAMRIRGRLGSPGRPADPWRTEAKAALIELDPVTRRQEAERLVREHFGNEASVVQLETDRLLASARACRRKLATAK